MSFEIKRPILVIGLGGAGSRLASKAAGILDCDMLLISNDSKDISSDTPSIHADTGAIVNPTINLVRTAAHVQIDRIRDRVSGHPTVLLVGNLAGKAGCAISPVVTEACVAENAKIISIAIMPFGYEKSQLFASGVALRRLRGSSECVIVLDNDSLLESNPDLTPKECYEIADTAIMHVLGSIDDSSLEKDTDNLLVTSRSRNREELDESLRDALKMLYGSVRPGLVSRSMLYAVGGDDIPVGMLQSVAHITRYITSIKTKNPSQKYEDVEAGVGITTISSETADSSRVVMLSKVQGFSKFEEYDPLGVIPNDNMLDWDIPECSIDSQALPDAYQLE